MRPVNDQTVVDCPLAGFLRIEGRHGLIVVAGAVAYLAWIFRPRRRTVRASSACGACAQHKQG